MIDLRALALSLALTLGGLSAPAQTFNDSATAPPARTAEEAKPGAAAAPEPGDQASDDPSTSRYREVVEVRERSTDLVGRADSASEGATGSKDLARRIIGRPGDLLETVPGLVATQHSGSGKANQYFLRGFNLDHGTDLAVSLAGLPLNEPTHGHGQGYVDLVPVIPELVHRVEFRKGLSSVEDGDFSAAGSARIELVDDLDGPLVRLEGGGGGYRRLLVGASTELAGATLLAGAESIRDDGPWQVPEDSDKVNTVVRLSRSESERAFHLTLLGGRADWTATDQIPARAVESGDLDRFGSLDSSDGGRTRRTGVTAQLWRADGDELRQVRAYVARSELDLYSNFTYFLSDPEHGDQFSQRDDRTTAGFALLAQRALQWSGRTAQLSYGLELRQDWIDNGLASTAARREIAEVRRDRVSQTMPSIWVESRVQWTERLRSVIGLRADGYRAQVESSLSENSGTSDDGLLAPKLSLAYRTSDRSEIYFGLGRGFHSNDARGATIRTDPVTREPVGRVPMLVPADGLDLGLRVSGESGWTLAVSAFALDLDSELVFVGDAGATEAGRPSRRTGVELTLFWRSNRYLSFDLDAAWNRARFRDDDPAGSRIPGSPEAVLSAGAALEGLNHLTAALRVRVLGPRPLTEDGSLRSSALSTWSARVAWRFDSGLELSLEALNLLDTKGSDIEYSYESRLPGEPERGIADVHFHPTEPRTFRLAAQWRF